MTDQFDRAQQLEEMQREIALKKHRTFKAVSRLYCEDCDAPIPEKRRQMIQGVTRCVTCQELEEKRQQQFRK
ncbi:TraR/DksA family transcriptional regulator [Haemophilus haemolyticus]|jgi:phage/conjugal plasmid C-4 type zinc finger protein, traR family|uniref:TraR/DksA family transcriptional regulator n=1 Tax=Haemophilus haemolyticus TaxID=726 RepID=UPI001126F00A|nr:TraR/DksA family transcriptional regulator [Haemophilus haemolyticus]TPH24144.1 TraR/DksA family transcriptional regulator [Haemophilus haemolyticus]DAJ68600.1 MAG TPA: DksA-like zinc finger domain containing protein [Caudoviricetes sp.]